MGFSGSSLRALLLSVKKKKLPAFHWPGAVVMLMIFSYLFFGATVAIRDASQTSSPLT